MTTETVLSFDYFRTVTHANIFEHQSGYSVTPLVQVEAKIPFIGSTGLVTISGESSKDWVYGGDNIESSTFTSSCPMTVPYNLKYMAYATLNLF